MENHHESCEPMDVDLSTNSNRMDISDNIEELDDYNPRRSNSFVKNTQMIVPKNTQDPICLIPIVKKYHINIQRTKSKARPRLWITAVIVLAIALISYNIANIKCISNLEILKIKETLSTKLYGQDVAIKQIIETLEAGDKIKILFLYGGTGVGKTYSVSLMMQNVWDSVNVYHFTSSTFAETFSAELSFGMTICKSSIFIIDDLNTKDVKIKKSIKDVVAKSNKMNKEVLIILIFNCDSNGSEFMRKCDNLFLKELDVSFSEVNAFKKLVHFQGLTKEHLKKCVVNELGNEKYEVKDFDNFLKNFNVERDGCKGVHTKMKLLKIL